MPAPSYIPNSPSGIDSDAVIEKLVAIERIPQKRMENEQAELRSKNIALNELIKSTKKLQARLKKLYGFEAEFESKKIEFLKEGYATGIANKEAQAGTYKIKINQLAKKLIFKSKEVPLGEQIKSGFIEINNKRKKFSGGKLEEFSEFLNENYNDLINVKYIRPNEKTALLLAETVKEGDEALLNISDTDGILQSLEMLSTSNTGNPSNDKDESKEANDENKDLPKKETHKDIKFSLENFSMLVEGPFQISENKNKLTLAEKSSRRFDQKPEIKTGETLKGLNFEYLIEGKKEKEEDNAPYSIIDGPVSSVNIKGNQLNTYNIERTRKKSEENSSETDYGLIVYYDLKNIKGKGNGTEKKIDADTKTENLQTLESSSEKESFSLKGKDKLVQIPLRGEIKYIDFYTSGTTFSIQNAKWIFDTDPNMVNKEKNEKDLDKDKFKNLEKFYPNLIQKAANASIELDDIPIERNKNIGIDDLIKGASINLLRESENPIQMKITRDSDESLKQVKEFIEAYNELMQISYELTKTSEIKQAGEYEKMKKESGILVGNSGVRSMVNGLKFRVSDSYPAIRKPYIKALPFIGVHTGEIGASWKSINKGYLQLDEKKFREMVLEHPAAVKEFFGIDTNADRKIDHGFAYRMHEFLEPYTQFTRGIYNTQIESNKRRIASLDKEIDRQERHVKVYREKLKIKYGNMEGKVREQKSTGKFIDQRLGNKK